MNRQESEKILVIKLSALGDFIQALGPMKAIRKHHPKAHITLLTTKMFKDFGEACGYFDDVWIDKRPKMLDLSAWITLRKKLIEGHFKRVYDLQNNDRTNFYFKLFPKGKKPEWVGTARGASHRNTSPERTAKQAFEGHVQTLGLAGITDLDIDDLGWVDEDLSDFNLRSPFVILVPGSAPQHPHKRWPAKYYGDLAQKLFKAGIHCVLLGTHAEKNVTDEIASLCPDVLNLTGQTTLFQIAALAQKAKGAIGNDTGPMHIIGPTGCPCLILFSGKSKPHRHAPKGKKIKIMQEKNLADISPETVFTHFCNLMHIPKH